MTRTLSRLFFICILTIGGCGGTDDAARPGGIGQPCNHDATGTDGCDSVSVCVAFDSTCHADCAQAACPGGTCAMYTASSGKAYSVCMPASNNAVAPAPPSCNYGNPIMNQSALVSSNPGEWPGQMNLICPGGGTPNCGSYCANNGQCCANVGHPEISCGSDQFCTSDGRCTTSASCATAPVGLFTSCSLPSDCLSRDGELTCVNGTCVIRPGGRCVDASWCGQGSICGSSGTCLALGSCASQSDCGAGQVCDGGKCVAGVSAGGGSGGGSGGNGSSCGTQCPSSCTGNVPEQACLYCQAACVCRCAGDSQCAAANAQVACSLGTCTCPF
jgi:hypothetical protein